MKCALCKIGDTQEDSHIVPRMVYRWLKNLSLSGFMRGTANPNQRMQDGPKIKLLCPDCEDRFSKYETEFANTVFHPIHTKQKKSISFNYEEWFHRFAVSVSWRSLAFLSLQEDNSLLPYGHGTYANQALEIWRAYLNNERDDIGSNIQHLLIVDEVSSASGLENDFDLNLYIQRGIDFNTIHSDKEGYIFTKLGKVIIAGVIINEEPNVVWENTEILSSRGSYAPGDCAVSSCFFTFLETAIQDIRKSRNKVSSKQVSKMNDTFLKKHGFRPKK